MPINHALEKLLAEKFDTPEFESVARVYADWLIEHDKPASEFIAGQLTLDSTARVKHEEAFSEQLLGRMHARWNKGFIRELRGTPRALSAALQHPVMRALLRLQCATSELEHAFDDQALVLPPSLAQVTLDAVPADAARLERLLSDHRLENVSNLMLNVYDYEQPPQPPTTGLSIRAVTAEEQAERRRSVRAVLDAIIAAPGARRWGRRLVLQLFASDVLAWRASVRRELPEVLLRPRFSWGTIQFQTSATPRFAPADWASIEGQRDLGDGAFASAGEYLQLRGEEMCAKCGSVELRRIYRRRWTWEAGRRPSTGVMQIGCGRREEFVCDECGAFTNLEEYDEPSFASQETWADDSWRT